MYVKGSEFQTAGAEHRKARFNDDHFTLTSYNALPTTATLGTPWVVHTHAARYCAKKVSPHSITERRVPELIPDFGSQPAGDMRYKPGGRLPLLSARHAVTPATLKKAATNFAAW